MARFPGRYCALTLTLSIVLGVYGSRACAQGFGPPWGCVQYPIIDMGDAYLYYADWYETSCDDNPEPCYVFGEYDYPQICPDCVPGNDVSSNRFRGLDEPISEEYVLQLPEGLPREYSEPVEIPGLKFVQFNGVKGDLITAKAFAFKIYPRRLRQKPGPDHGRIVVVAMQLTGEPSVEPVKLKCKAIDKPEACYAYSAKYDQGASEPLPILILTAK